MEEGRTARGEKAYIMYATLCNWRNSVDAPMLPWTRLSERIKVAWATLEVQLGRKTAPLLTEEELSIIRFCRMYDTTHGDTPIPGSRVFKLVAKLADWQGV